jgi:hypothetical protein
MSGHARDRLKAGPGGQANYDPRTVLDLGRVRDAAGLVASHPSWVMHGAARRDTLI